MTLMLEEYLDGPEVDVDLVLSEGQVGSVGRQSWICRLRGTVCTGAIMNRQLPWSTTLMSRALSMCASGTVYGVLISAGPQWKPREQEL